MNSKHNNDTAEGTPVDLNTPEGWALDFAVRLAATGEFTAEKLRALAGVASILAPDAAHAEALRAALVARADAAALPSIANELRALAGDVRAVAEILDAAAKASDKAALGGNELRGAKVAEARKALDAVRGSDLFELAQDAPAA